MNRLLVVAYFLEVGLILILVPWSGFWERNYFTHMLPLADSFLSSPVVRGAVSGLGVINVVAGIADLASLLASRRH